MARQICFTIDSDFACFFALPERIEGSALLWKKLPTRLTEQIDLSHIFTQKDKTIADNGEILRTLREWFQQGVDQISCDTFDSYYTALIGEYLECPDLIRGAFYSLFRLPSPLRIETSLVNVDADVDGMLERLLVIINLMRRTHSLTPVSRHDIKVTWALKFWCFISGHGDTDRFGVHDCCKHLFEELLELDDIVNQKALCLESINLFRKMVLSIDASPQKTRFIIWEKHILPVWPASQCQDGILLDTHLHSFG